MTDARSVSAGRPRTDRTSYIASDKPLYIADLVSRMDRNEAFGDHDFEQWVLSHFDYPPGCDVLDVACGTGKAVFKLLARHPAIGTVTAVDFAEPAIRALDERARTLGHANVHARLLDMETLATTLAPQRFDHIFSIYGVHYSPRLVDLLAEYRPLLAPGGTLFFCGPDAFCNGAVMRILSAFDAIETEPIPARMLRPFIAERDLRRLRESFASVEVDHFENPIRFTSAEAFMGWWRHHDLYRVWAEAEMASRVSREIERTGAFVVNKNVLGVRLRTGGGTA